MYLCRQGSCLQGPCPVRQRLCEGNQGCLPLLLLQSPPGPPSACPAPPAAGHAVMSRLQQKHALNQPDLSSIDQVGRPAAAGKATVPRDTETSVANAHPSLTSVPPAACCVMVTRIHHQIASPQRPSAVPTCAFFAAEACKQVTRSMQQCSREAVSYPRRSSCSRKSLQ